jgi:hypothetical protein
MTCQQIPLDTLKQWLNEARAALHKLQTGSLEASVSFGPSKSVSYTAANIDELRRYINDLTTEIDERENCGKPSPRRPIRMRY